MNGEAVTEQQDVYMHEQILDFIVEKGPTMTTVIAEILDLTAAAARRHITILLNSGQIIEHESGVIGKRGRGRPVRHYTATKNAHTSLSEGYSRLTPKALGYLGQVGGGEAIEGLAAARSREIERCYALIIRAVGGDPRIHAFALADALIQDDYVAIVCDTDSGRIIVQLCQGHCPIQQVTGDSPALCEMETRAFAKLLGVHV